MKVCKSCGAINSDERIFCVDCGEKLGDKLDAVNSAVITAAIKEKSEALYNQNDPLHISVYDKIMGILSAICGLFLIICLVVLLYRGENVAHIGVGLIFALCGIVEAFCPKIVWALEEMRLSLTVSDANLTPSNFYMFSKKFSEAFCCIVSIAIIIASVMLVL